VTKLSGATAASPPSMPDEQARAMFGCTEQALDSALHDKDPVAASNVATTATPVTVMGLCETAQLFLHPNQTYRFVVMPGCPRCAELARHADGPVGPAEPLDSIPAEGADGNGPKAPEAREP
jgi:hypothetical protein